MVRKYLYVLEKDHMTKEEIRNLALFIDFENYSHDISFDAKALFEMLNLPKEGRLSLKELILTGADLATISARC